jgi:glycosyltransferase involved in cell wall biosynthesis
MSIVVPAYNEALGLPKVASTISDNVKDFVGDWEIIIVDDGSSDETYKTIGAMSAEDPRVKGLRLSRNFGKEAAILCGLKAAAGNVIVTIDSDLQHPPSLIPKMLEKWAMGAMVVHAVKRNRQHDSLAAKIRAALFNRVLSRLADIDLNNSTDFKLLDRLIVNSLVRELPERRRFYRGLAGWIGYPAASVEFDVESREQGEGRWSGLRLVDLAVSAIVSFTSAPLRIVTILGFLTLLLGVVVGTDAIVSWMRGRAVSGFASIIITLLIVGSFIMISLGILGEYVAKIYDEIKRRPVYFVQDTVGLVEDQARSARRVVEDRRAIL